MSGDLSQLIDDLKAGQRRALGQALSMVENREAGYQDLLAACPQKSQAFRVGFAGPPGSGKSTLINALAKRCLDDHQKVAVLATDPSSPHSGGALLGDRVRLKELNPEQIFFRSLGSRYGSGGQSDAVLPMSRILELAGFEQQILETVGTGQNDVAVADLSDTTVLVTVPESGDIIQAMKAGVIELAHIVVVNKADRPGAELVCKDIEEALHISGRDDVPVIQTVATEGQGLDDFVQALRAHRAQFSEDSLKAQRMQRLKQTLIRQATSELARFVSSHPQKCQPLIEHLMTGQESIEVLSQQLLKALADHDDQ